VLFGVFLLKLQAPVRITQAKNLVKTRIADKLWITWGYVFSLYSPEKNTPRQPNSDEPEPR
jgi:hypothetical protein